MMMSNSPNSSDERKRLLQSFFDLPSQEKKVFYHALEHLRPLTILWNLEEFDPNSMPGIPEKRHTLLAYKFLHILWFDRLPDQHDESFTLYVRDRLPEEQTLETINGVFDRSAQELENFCKEIARPTWLKNSIEVKTSIESFPQKSP